MMNSVFINLLSKNFIEKKDYLPLRGENGEIPEYRGRRILERQISGSYSILEILDGDEFSGEEREARVGRNNNALQSIEKNCIFFEVIVFRSSPDSEKLETIKNGQYRKYPGKKLFGCLIVNLTEKRIEKLDKTSLSSGGLDKVINMSLSESWQDSNIEFNLEELVQEKEREAAIHLVARKPYVSYILICINIAVWLAITLYALQNNTKYELLLNRFGEKNNLDILSGEYWRFVTPIFLHGGIVHLFLNCYSTYAVGFFVERLFGHKKFIFVYFTAGIIGNIASFIFSINPGVGASGAIFGLMGALLYYGLENPTHFKRYFGQNVILMIVLNVGYGFSRTGIDNFAHLGGLLGGFLASGVISTKRLSIEFLNRFVFIILTIAVILGGLYYGFNNDQNTVLRKVNLMEKQGTENKWADAEKTAEEILNISSEEGIRLEALIYAAQAEIILGKNDQAIEHGKEILKLDPKRGHYILGISYFYRAEYEKSRQELLQAKKLNAEFENIDQILNQIDELLKQQK
jgi:rhomboid protease GluP